MDDILVGADRANENGTKSGTVYLFHGDVSGEMTGYDADAALWGETTNAYAGYALAGLGDLNGDGYADIVIGSPGQAASTGSGAGVVHVVHGPLSDTETLGIAHATLTGTIGDEAAGSAVCNPGDVNADGTPDILVSGPSNAGGVSYLIYGPVSGTQVLDDAADALFEGASNGDEAGYSLAGVGDTNGDGYSDLMVGAWNASGLTGLSQAGAAYLVQGGGL